MNRGWECPRCRKVNGPHIDACGCSGPGGLQGAVMPLDQDWKAFPGLTPTARPFPGLTPDCAAPSLPLPVMGGGCDACRISGVCMCVRRAPVWTNWQSLQDGMPGQAELSAGQCVMSDMTVAPR